MNSVIQPYDTWIVHGNCASCGGLWIAALPAATAMEDVFDHKDSTEKYRIHFQKVKAVYEEKQLPTKEASWDMKTRSLPSSWDIMYD